jgi:two-component system, NtrC family, C4-dicarboxylate transport response regulator DctD
MSSAFRTAEGSPVTPRVFLVEDDPIVRRGSEQALLLAQMQVVPFGDAESALAALQRERPWAIVSDVRLPNASGLDLLREVRQRDRDLPVVLVTGHGDVAMAVEAMREGAYDFIEKPFPSERLVDTVRRAVERHALREENRRLREQLPDGGGLPLIGQSPAVQELRRQIAALAPANVDVLIRGKTGSGKEVVARALHTLSGRTGPFVALNCGALPESIVESELFGHEAGAFTGAARRRIGRIEHAHLGTLLLDEIESMPLATQVKLLRVLQERQVERLGSNQSVAVDCRVIAAAKDDLKQLSDAGRFRADLYYRLNVVALQIPPLRERPGDVPLLMAHFLQEAASRFGKPAPQWSDNDMLRWRQHAWPGNVRELRNVAERIALGLPDGLQEGTARELTLPDRLDALERSLVSDAMAQAGDNVARAADLLGIPKKTLYDKLSKLKG